MRNPQIPDRYRSMNFDSFRALAGNKEALEACWSYTENWQKKRLGQCLAIFAGPGAGKTHLAVAVCKELSLLYGVDAVYSCAGDVAQFGSTNERRNRGCGFLVIDDLGFRQPSLAALVSLLTLIDYRLLEAMPMLVTSRAIDWTMLHQGLFLGVKYGEAWSDTQKVVIPAALRIIGRLAEAAGEGYAITGKRWSNFRGRAASTTND